MKSVTILGFEAEHVDMPGSSAEHPEIIPGKLPEQSPPLGHTWAACPGPSLHICRSTQCRCKCLVPKEAGRVAAVYTEIPACPDRGCSAQHLYLLLSSAASRGCTWGRGFCLQNIYTSPWRRSAPAGLGGGGEMNPILPLHPEFSAAGLVQRFGCAGASSLFVAGSVSCC